MIAAIAVVVVILLIILFGLWALVRSGADADLKMEELMNERETEKKVEETGPF